MTRCSSLGWTLVVGVVLLSPSSGRAGIFMITTGSTVKHVGEVPESQRRSMNETLTLARLIHPTVRLTRPAVGFRYKYFGVFWVEFWTWGGTYCLYEQNQALAIKPEKAAELLGREVGDLPKPFVYRFPPGLLGLGVLALLTVPVGLVARRRHARSKELLADPRYAQALQAYAASDQSEAAFEDAVLSLEREGIERREAIRNLRRLLALRPAA